MHIDLLLAHDCNGPNTGVFKLRSSPSALELLEDMYNGPHVMNKTIRHEWWEQRSFLEMYIASEDAMPQCAHAPLFPSLKEFQLVSS